MIITKPLPYAGIKKKLKKADRIGIVSCNACARICRTGGEKGERELAARLAKDGYNVVDMDLIGAPCDYSQLKKKELHGNATLVLACDSGVYNLKKLFPKRRIIPALKTVGLGAWDEKGHLWIVKRLK